MNMRRALVPDISNLQAFECAARHGNFTRAAEELNLTQSAVSRQIRDLEQQTGLLLFERVRQRVILSEAGRRLIPDVRRLLQQSEQLMIGAVASAASVSSLSVATLPTFGTRWLMPRLPDFMVQNKDLALSIESRSKPFDFDEENFDLAIHYGQPVWARATCTFLCSEVVLPVATERLMQKLDLRDPSDLCRAPLLHLTTRPRLWAHWFENSAITADNAYRGSRFDQFSMIIAAAVSGLGVALLPSYLIEQEIGSRTLLPLFNIPMATENGYYIVLPEGRQRNETANAFRDWLLTKVSAVPSDD
jgi:LysR family glycine cleavage system transcriptional activator